MNAIIETLNLWGGQALGFAWPMLWQSSLLIAVLFALDLALRHKLRAAVRYALWLVVLAKLVLPPSLALPTGIGWWLRPATVTPTKLQTASFVVSEVPTPAPSLPTPEPPSFTPPPRAPMTAAAWALVGWCAVGLGLLAWLVVRWWQVARDVGRAGAAPESVSETLGEARRLAGVRRTVRLRLTDRPMSPAVCGVFRPVILLPRSLTEQLAPAQLRAVLLHELTHLRRGDVWVNCAQALLQIVYWWHPLLWLANARIRRVREDAVDDAVMLALREDADTYAPTLLEVAKLAFNRPLASLGLVGILESRSVLRQRIERLVDFRAPRRAGLSVLSLLGIAAFAAVAAPMGEAPPSRAHLSETPHTDPTSVPDSNGITEPGLDGETIPAATQASQTGQASTLSFQRELNKLMAQKTEWQRQIIAAKSQVASANQKLNHYTTLGIQDNIEQWQKLLEEWRERLKTNEAGLDKVSSDLHATIQTFLKANEENLGICPGDSIDVTVAGDEFVTDYETFTGTYQVRQGGYIIMPRVGRIFLAGKTFTEAGQAIRDALAKSGSPNANVTVKRSQKSGGSGLAVFLCGEFIRPGAWPVPPGDKPTIVTAILRSGGVRPAADLTRVQLLRLVNGPAQVEEVNVQAIMSGAGLPSDLALKPGDIVFVPAFANLVYVTGCVVKPGAVKLLPDDELTAYSAILWAGGFDRFANRKKVYIVRDLGNGAKQKIPASIKELQEGAGSDLILKSKDIVVVPEQLNVSPEGESKDDSAAPPSEQTNRAPVPRLSDLPLYGRFFRAEGETNHLPTPSPKETEVAGLVQEGKLLWELGRFQEAEAKLKAVLETDPENRAAHYYLSLVNNSLAGKAKPPSGRQRIIGKLNRIRLASVTYDGLRLDEVVRRLSDEVKQLDPEKEGINFLILTKSDPAKEGANFLMLTNLSTVRIEIKPALTDIRLADALEAIVKGADKPINYSVEDYAILFQAKTAEPVGLYTRTYKIDTNAFFANVRKQAGLAETNSLGEYSQAIRTLFHRWRAGVDLNAPKTIYINESRGLLLVRATLADLDQVEELLLKLNSGPPQVNIEASPQQGASTAPPSRLPSQRHSAEPTLQPRAHVEVSQGLPASATNAVLNLVLTAPSSLTNWSNKTVGHYGLMKSIFAADVDKRTGGYYERRLLAIRPEGFVMMFAEWDTGMPQTNIVLFRYGEITETNTPRWKIVGQFE